VCTANLCRSPMAAALFRRRLVAPDATTGPDGTLETVAIGSAGLLPSGVAPPGEVVTVMAELGIDLGAHRSRQISPELVAVADVVVCMARRHAREVVLVEPEAWSRTFTLKELVRRGEGAGPRQEGEGPGDWLRRVHAGRVRAELVGQSAADDVEDPLGGPLDAYRVTAAELADLVDHVAGRMWPARSTRGKRRR